MAVSVKRIGERLMRPSEELSKEITDRVRRGRDRLGQIAPETNEAFEFWRGNQYWYIDQKGILQQQIGGPAGVRMRGKPSWRVREPHNLIIDVVAHEVSAATQRVPSYDVVPSTGDPEDASAASVARQVLLYGYDKWNIRDVMVRLVTHAVVGGEGFAWPYWDPTIGPFIGDEGVGVGDVCVEVYGRNQVFWEPGQRFEDSSYHCIDIAMTPEAAKRLPRFKGGELTPDADTISQAGRGKNKAERKMVLVTYYLERPSPDKPEGRWVTIANGRRICDDDVYPGDGQSPCIHRLSYISDPDSDRDMGLVHQLLPALRTYNDAWNKIVEWKNLHLMGGRLFVTPSLLDGQQITDEPGAVYEIPNPNENVKVWEAPPVPQELFQILEEARAEIARIAAQNDIPSQVEAGKAIQALIERDTSRRSSFLANVADVHGKIGTSNLKLVQEYYKEDRTLHIKGDFDWDSLKDFQGADLKGQCDVRVFPSSIEPLTRENVEQRVIAFADRQWISPEAAMHAINTGTAENLIKDIEISESRVHRIIRRIKEGPDALFSMPPRIVPGEPDPLTGIPGPSMTVPGWMPLPWDNLRLWRNTFETWFSTEAAEMLPPAMQEAANLVYQKVLELEAIRQMQVQAAQMSQAAQLGMDNAAGPQGPPSSPDMPKLGQGGPSTPNQPGSQSTPS